jgi:hypothetical protein
VVTDRPSASPDAVKSVVAIENVGDAINQIAQTHA